MKKHYFLRGNALNKTVKIENALYKKDIYLMKFELMILIVEIIGLFFLVLFSNQYVGDSIPLIFITVFGYFTFVQIIRYFILPKDIEKHLQRV